MRKAQGLEGLPKHSFPAYKPLAKVPDDHLTFSLSPPMLENRGSMMQMDLPRSKPTSWINERRLELTRHKDAVHLRNATLETWGRRILPSAVYIL